MNPYLNIFYLVSFEIMSFSLVNLTREVFPFIAFISKSSTLKGL